MTKRALLFFGLTALLVAALSAAGGYHFGFAEAVARAEDVRNAMRLVEAERNLKVLTALREKKGGEWILDLEVSTIMKLSDLDPGQFAAGSASEYTFKHLAPVLTEYRKRYPETAINAQRDPKLAKILWAN